MSALGVGLGPFDQLAPESTQTVQVAAPEFPFVMLSVPAWWAIVGPAGFVVTLVEGGAKHPTAALGFAAHAPRRAATARAARGWTVRPATADEIAAHT